MAQDAAARDGMEAAVQGEWAKACVAFAKSKDGRSSTRLSMARRGAVTRLTKLMTVLTRKKMWRELAEVAACGLEIQPGSRRFLGAADRAAAKGAPKPKIDTRVRHWATGGADFLKAHECIQRCVEFLVKAQEADGLWDAKKHKGGDLFGPGVTGLALLAVVPYRREAADRAAAALLKIQDRHGVFGSRRTHSFIYNHTIATFALAEYILYTGAGQHVEKLQLAVDFIQEAQSPGGGWRYVPGGEESDTSVTAWATSALHAAQRAGAQVKETTYHGAMAWTSKMTDPKFGNIGYNYPGGACARPEGKQDAFPPEHSAAMCAAGCVVFAIARNRPFRFSKSMARIECMLPQTKYADMYYWNLGARAFVRAYGRIPANWFNALVESVATLQRPDGSIPPSGVWGADGGTIYSTAICANALGAPYRERRSPRLSPRAFLQSKKRLVEVPGWAYAVPTGIYVDSGTVVTIDAKGAVQGYAKGPHVQAARARKGDSKVKGRASGGALCLLGSIDDEKPFPIAVGKKNTMRRAGHLWLMVNDRDYQDNNGWYDVTITLVR